MTNNFTLSSSINSCCNPSRNTIPTQLPPQIVPDIRLSSTSLQNQYYNTLSTPASINNCCEVSSVGANLPSTVINSLSKTAGLAVSSLSTSDIETIVRSSTPSSNFSTDCCILKEGYPLRSSQFLGPNPNNCYNEKTNIIDTLLISNLYLPKNPYYSNSYYSNSYYSNPYYSNSYYSNPYYSSRYY
jgi:hypothetical protein